jgi:hypothetical protein
MEITCFSETTVSFHTCGGGGGTVLAGQTEVVLRPLQSTCRKWTLPFILPQWQSLEVHETTARKRATQLVNIGWDEKKSVSDAVRVENGTGENKKKTDWIKRYTWRCSRNQRYKARAEERGAQQGATLVAQRGRRMRSFRIATGKPTSSTRGRKAWWTLHLWRQGWPGCTLLHVAPLLSVRMDWKHNLRITNRKP